MSLPLISIIIPTYNRAHLISETLDSIITQTYTNWECIIVDDGSTDHTEETVAEYIKKDARFQYHIRPDTHKPGGNGARNYGFSLSKGEYINWFDSDDLMHPEKLEIQYNLLNSSPYIDFVISQTAFFNNSTDKIIGLWNKSIKSDDNLNDFILKKIGWSTSSPLWRKSSILKNNLKFDERLKNGQDFKFHVEVLMLGLKFKAINENLTFNRVHQTQIKSKKNKSNSKAIIYRFIYNHKKELKTYTISFVEEKLVNLIASLYRDKNFKQALQHSWFVLRNIITFKAFFYNLFFNVAGFFHLVTNKGYRLLKRKYSN